MVSPSITVISFGLIAAELDVVLADGAPVTGVDDLIRLLNGERIGRRIAIDVLRRGALRSFEVTPLERPAARAS